MHNAISKVKMLLPHDYNWFYVGWDFRIQQYESIQLSMKNGEHTKYLQIIIWQFKNVNGQDFLKLKVYINMFNLN